MKKYLSYIVALTIILIGLSSCHTSAPRLDYKALAQASVRLGVDIELQDNHKLYIHASEWIGTPYRAGGDSKRGTDCSGLVSQLYKKVYHTRLSRSTDGQLKESSKISRRNLREGDLVFFTSRVSRKKSGTRRHLPQGRQVYTCQHQPGSHSQQPPGKILHPTLALRRKNKIILIFPSCDFLYSVPTDSPETIKRRKQ